MQSFIINGGRKLGGEIDIHGAKNSVLPLISATVLLNGKSVLHNCPDLSDVDAALDIISSLGLSYSKNGGTLSIDSLMPGCYEIPDELMRKMRSSVMFLGAILGRCNKAVISMPGGCKLGPRPIDIHIKALSRLGATVTERNGRLEFEAKNGLKGAEVLLDFPSVGATENVILAAATAEGKTTLLNAAREPEIKDLTDFLNAAGAKIVGGGTDTLVIRGVKELGAAEFSVMPDRIEAATYMCAAAATCGDITLKNICAGHLTAVNKALTEAGCDITVQGGNLRICAPGRLSAITPVRTRVYPGFPTDAGPLLISALSCAKGTSVLYESIFQNRYGFVDELNRFGTAVQTFGLAAVVNGVEELHGTSCVCTDLRGGAAVVIAALKANGISTVGDVCHIKRGYENFAANLKSLGADIKEV